MQHSVCTLLAPKKSSSIIALAFLAAAGLATNTHGSELTIRNRSTYSMIYAAWSDGSNCSNRISDTPSNTQTAANFKPAETIALKISADTLAAVGVAIFDMEGKNPVVCDYILSFTLQPSTQYLLEYDVLNRRCYGHLYRSENGAFNMVIPGDKENLQERFTEFSWDQFEPGCAPL